MKIKLITPLLALLSLTVFGENITNYPKVEQAKATDMFLLSSIPDKTNRNIFYPDLVAQLQTNLSSTYLPSGVLTNYATGVTISGTFHGRADTAGSSDSGLTSFQGRTNAAAVLTIGDITGINHTMHQNALRTPLMGWMGGIGWAQYSVAIIADAMRAKGLTDLGYNTITVDAQWGTNSLTV
jgi:hypothetical protein